MPSIPRTLYHPRRSIRQWAYDNAYTLCFLAVWFFVCWVVEWIL